MNSAKFPIVVEKLLNAAINTVLLFFVSRIDSSIKLIATTVFTSCSVDCALDVIFIDSLPLKYPLKTDVIETKKMDGLNAIIESFDSSIFK